uniref:Uncharacterized protein n=1 Tax=Arundo donax TaxID=35708 RepID=A0A0A9CMD4_ARUDO
MRSWISACTSVLGHLDEDAAPPSPPPSPESTCCSVAGTSSSDVPDVGGALRGVPASWCDASLCCCCGGCCWSGAAEIGLGCGVACGGGGGCCCRGGCFGGGGVWTGIGTTTAVGGCTDWQPMRWTKAMMAASRDAAAARS